MPQINEQENSGEETQPNPRDDAQTRILQELQGMGERISATNAMQNFLADPDFARLLQAKQSGKKIKLIDQDEEEAPEPEIDSEKLEEMSKADLLKLFDSRSTKTLTKLLKKQLDAAFKERLTPLAEDLNGVKQRVGKNDKENIKKTIDEVKKKYPDFNQFTEKMVKLHEETGLESPEELYFLAKIRSGVPLVSPNKLASERPNTSPARSGKPQKTRHGAAGFAEMLRETMASNPIDFDELE